MSERWLNELKRFRSLEPPVSLQRRIDERTGRPGRPGREPARRDVRHRFVAAVVALLLAVISTTFLFRTLDTSPPQRPPSAEGSVANGKIAFVSDGTIRLIDHDGTNLTEIRAGDPRNFDTRPMWSPDGTQIAFLHSVEGRFELLLFDVTSGRIVTVAGPEFDVDSPQWSPDSTRIAFVSGSEVYVGRTDGAKPSILTKGAFPAWSPDGTRIAFESVSGVSVVDAGGANTTVLSPGSSPAWSPDGGKIAFIDERLHVTVMNADGTGLTQLTDTQYDDLGRPTWSPDGSRIAFEALRGGNYDIYIVNEDGTEFAHVTRDSGDENVPTWSPDGTKIAFIAGEAVSQDPGATSTFDLYVMNANGTERTRLTRGEAPAYTLSWQSLHP